MSLFFILSLLSGFVLDNANDQFCQFKDFNHFYIKYVKNGTKIHDNHRNSLPNTPVNEFALLTDPCLNENGLPELVHCLENQKWEKRENVTCLADISDTSKFLSEIQLEMNQQSSQNSSSKATIMNNICTTISRQNHSLVPFDVVNLDRIVNRIISNEPQEDVGTEMIDLYSHLMASNDSVLQLSARLNATNNLLFHFENYMNDLANKLYLEKGVRTFIGEKLSAFFVYPELSKYTGIAIYSKEGPNRLGCDGHNIFYRFLFANQSLDELKNEADLQAATFLTDELWQGIQSDKVKCLVFKVYESHALFVDTSANNETNRSGSYVLSINIPGTLSNSLPYPLALVLHNENFGILNAELSTNDYCGYWDYDTWRSSDVTTNSSGIYDPAVVCYTTRLAQFTFLAKCSGSHSHCSAKVLLVSTTTVGCGLSLFGLLGIWLTAAISKQWRSRNSTKILLNLSLAMTILLVLLLFTYVNEWLWKFSFTHYSIECIALGTLLQYSLLLLFSWMLVIGYLQYRRFDTIIVVRSEYLVTNAIIIAWSLPLGPTILLLLFGLKSYRPLSFDENAVPSLCFPSGIGMSYTVVLPIGLVLIFNVAVTLCIFCRICKISNEEGILWLKLRLFILLFFLLGLPWIFGFCAYFELGFVFTVLFCVTATIQGFVLFSRFVLFDEAARTVWLQLFSRNINRSIVPQN